MSFYENTIVAKQSNLGLIQGDKNTNQFEIIK